MHKRETRSERAARCTVDFNIFRLLTLLPNSIVYACVSERTSARVFNRDIFETFMPNAERNLPRNSTVPSL